MKRFAAFILLCCILFSLSACSNSNADGSAYPEDLITEDFKIPLGDTGAKVAIPAEMGFEAYESELNEFFGGGPSGEWRIIVNTEVTSDYTEYTFEEYANLYAQSNGAEGVTQDAAGNYCFTYINESSEGNVYKFYSLVLEGIEKYYHISFYCFEDAWDYYCEQFVEWATTIEVE